MSMSVLSRILCATQPNLANVKMTGSRTKNVFEIFTKSGDKKNSRNISSRKIASKEINGNDDASKKSVQPNKSFVPHSTLTERIKRLNGKRPKDQDLIEIKRLVEDYKKEGKSLYNLPIHIGDFVEKYITNVWGDFPQRDEVNSSEDIIQSDYASHLAATLKQNYEEALSRKSICGKNIAAP